jgi:LacI family transcriptional regulator
MTATAKGQMVGVIVSDITNPFYVDVAHGVAAGVDGAGMLSVIGDCRDDADRQFEIANALLAQGIKGLVITTPHTESALTLPVPVVAIDRPPGRVPYVAADNILGGRLATQHLLRCGYARVGILFGEPHLAPVADRIEGYRDALRRQGIDRDATLEVDCGGLDYASGFAGAGRLLDANADGIFAISDVMASGALAAVVERRLGVPAQVGIVGYDDTPMAAWPTVNLTSVAQGSFALGQEAARMLLQRISRPGFAPESTILPPRLSVRGSTRPPA